MAVDVAQLVGLSDDLKKTGRQVTKELRFAVAKVTEQVERDAKANAPVRTGALRDSIQSTVRGKTGEVFTDQRYGAYVEFGDYKDQPQPYIGPAGDAAAEPLASEVEAAVIRALGLL